MTASTTPITESDEEEDDAFLMEAAEQWATQTHDENEDEVDNKGSKNSEDGASKESVSEQKKKKKKKSKTPLKVEKVLKTEGSAQTKRHEKQSTTSPENTSPLKLTTPQTFSLHLTKIPYTTTQSIIRFAFLQKGCHVTSIRLVYDTNQSTGEKHFRGVAFVDLADEISFQKGLEFHQTAFLGGGRKVNVRVTRSKGELSEIVKRTEQKVADLIARSKEKKEKEKSDHAKDGKCFKDVKGGNHAGKKRKFEDRKSGGEAKKKNIGDMGACVGGDKTKDVTAIHGNEGEMGSKQNNRRQKKRNEEEKPKMHKNCDPQSSKGGEKGHSNSNNTIIVKTNENRVKSKSKHSKKSERATTKRPMKEVKSTTKNQNSSKSTKEKVKLTKQQRAKKAAVIRSKMLKSKR
ncbi:hypothetical protein ACHAXS_014379 [Conticribra weissflogii]